MTEVPKSADPEDVARKRAAAPTLKMPPEPEWSIGENGDLVHYKMQSMGVVRKARNRLAELIYNALITHIPSHTVRLGYLRMFGATIGQGSAIMRTTTVLDIEFLTIGDCTTIGSPLSARCPRGSVDREQRHHRQRRALPGRWT